MNYIEVQYFYIKWNRRKRNPIITRGFLHLAQWIEKSISCIQETEEQQHYPINQPSALSSATDCLSGNIHKGRRGEKSRLINHMLGEEVLKGRDLNFNRSDSNKRGAESSNHNSRAGPQKTCLLRWKWAASFAQTYVTAVSRTGLRTDVGHRMPRQDLSPL